MREETVTARWIRMISGEAATRSGRGEPEAGARTTEASEPSRPGDASGDQDPDERRSVNLDQDATAWSHASA